MLRIRLGLEDLARLRLASSGVASPIEAMYSVMVLRGPAAGPAFRRWRARMRRLAGPETGPLLDLLRPDAGDLPDFLLTRTGDLGAYLETVASTPADALGAQLRAVYGGLRPSMYARDLASGDRAARTALITAIESYYRAFAADWPVLRETAAADLAERSSVLARAGLGAVLESLHPGLRWRPPALEIDRPGPDREIEPGGRPVVLVPALFLWGRPRVLLEPDGPLFVTYPAGGALRLPADPAAPDDPLTEALGRTRAQVLRALRTGRTTTQLAEQLAVSAASASEHTAVLRRAGLVASRREGRAVRHMATPLGLELLGAETAPRTGRG